MPFESFKISVSSGQNSVMPKFVGGGAQWSTSKFLLDKNQIIRSLQPQGNILSLLGRWTRIFVPFSNLTLLKAPKRPKNQKFKYLNEIPMWLIKIHVFRSLNTNFWLIFEFDPFGAPKLKIPSLERCHYDLWKCLFWTFFKFDPIKTPNRPLKSKQNFSI